MGREQARGGGHDRLLAAPLCGGARDLVVVSLLLVRPPPLVYFALVPCVGGHCFKKRLVVKCRLFEKARCP